MTAMKMRTAQKRSRAVLQRDAYVSSLLEALGAQYKQSLQVDAFRKVDRLTPEEFHRRYYYANRPVVIRGLMRGWKALGLWTPDYFARTFGQYTVEINRGRSRDPRFDRNFFDHNSKIRMSDYVAMIQGGGETNDYYMAGRNSLLHRRPFRILFSHFRCPPGFLDPRGVKRKAFLWFGPKGTVTPLHHDSGNGMLAQVYGRKQIKLIPPFETQNLHNHECFCDVDLENIDYKKFPSMKGVTILETVLEPGDFIFTPIGWWHSVKSLDVSISLSFTNFCVPGQPVAWQWRYPSS